MNVKWRRLTLNELITFTLNNFTAIQTVETGCGQLRRRCPSSFATAARLLLDSCSFFNLVLFLLPVGRCVCYSSKTFELRGTCAAEFCCLPLRGRASRNECCWGKLRSFFSFFLKSGRESCVESKNAAFEKKPRGSQCPQFQSHYFLQYFGLDCIENCCPRSRVCGFT